jgi:hypothetical protein
LNLLKINFRIAEMSVQFAQISKLSSEYQLTPGAVEVNEAFQLFADNLKVGLECVSSDPSAADITINIAGELLQKIGVPHEKIVIVNGPENYCYYRSPPPVPRWLP